MIKVTCPFCGNDEIQVGIKGINVFGTGCLVLEHYASFTEDIALNKTLVSSKILCQKCNNSFSVQTEKSKDERAVFLNLRVANLDNRFSLMIKNNELVPPYYVWETQVPPGQSVNYTQSADFYMHFLAPQDPRVTLENLSTGALYELGVFRIKDGVYKEKKVLVPANYNGDHNWAVDLDVNDGIRIMAYSVKSFLLKNDLVGINEFIGGEEIPDMEMKLNDAIIKTLCK